MSAARPPLPLQALVDALASQSDQMHAFVDPDTAAVILVSDEALGAAESPGMAPLVDEAELEAAQAVLATPGILNLPDRFEIDEYRMMVRFAEARAIATERDTLALALRGSGAFRRFKDACARLGIDQGWYAFRDAEYEAIAVEWCHAHGVAWTRDAVAGGPGG